MSGLIGLGKYGSTRDSLQAGPLSPATPLLPPPLLLTLPPLWVSARGLGGCDVDGEMGVDEDGVEVDVDVDVEVGERAFAQNLRNWRMNLVIVFSSVR